MRHRKLVAVLLSFFLPGLGQIYTGDRLKGWALLAIDAGLILSLLFFGSALTGVFVGIFYLMVMIPAVRDAYRAASGIRQEYRGESRVYVVIMLLVVGPFALPLLWQNPRFSDSAKRAWTIIVVVFSVLLIVTLALLGKMFDLVIHLMR